MRSYLFQELISRPKLLTLVELLSFLFFLIIKVAFSYLPVMCLNWLYSVPKGMIMDNTMGMRKKWQKLER